MIYPCAESGTGWRHSDRVKPKKGCPSGGVWSPLGTDLMNVGAVNRNAGNMQC